MRSSELSPALHTGQAAPAARSATSNAARQAHWQLLRVLLKLHLWGGLALALPLVLAAITGALLLFKFDYVRLTVPGADRDVSRVAVSEQAQALEAAERIFGVSQLKSIRLADSRIGLHELWLQDHHGAYLDPYTYKVVKHWSRSSDPLDVLFDFHHTLLAGKTGAAVMGTVALFASVLVILGIWLWAALPGRFR